MKLIPSTLGTLMIIAGLGPADRCAAQLITTEGTEALVNQYRAAKDALDAGQAGACSALRAALSRHTDAESAALLTDLLNAFATSGSPAPSSSNEELERIAGDAERRFGKYSKPHLDALTVLSWQVGYADPDRELALNQELLGFYERDPTTYWLELADCCNTAGINMGLRGDREQEMRLLRAGLEHLASGTSRNATESARQLNGRWNLLNSLAQAEMNAGKLDNARRTAHQSKLILMQIDPESPQQVIADQVIARTWWLADRNLDSCLWYIDRAIGRLEALPKESGLGKGSAPWISYTSYKCDYLLDAGKNAQALGLAEAAAPYLVDAVYQLPGLRESAMKLLLTRAKALTRSARFGEAESTLAEARRKLRLMNQQRDLLALFWSYAQFDFLEESGRIAQAAALVDSMMTAHRLLVSDAERRPATAMNTAWVDALVHYGRFHLRHRAVDRALLLLRSAARLYLANQASFFSAGTEESSAFSNQDPIAALLEALHAANEREPDSGSPEEAARLLADAKAALLNQSLLQEQRLSAMLPAAVERERVALRARVFSASSAYMNAPSNEALSDLQHAQHAYEAKLAALQVEYPGAFTAHKQAHTCTAMEAAAVNDAWVVDYYLAGDDLFILSAGPNRLLLERRAWSKDLTQLLLSSTSGLRTSNGPTLDPYRYTRKLLLAGVIADDGRELIIVPHRELFLLSFEALSSIEAGKFLLHERPVRYALSSSMLCDRSALHERLRVGAFSATEFRGLPADAPELGELRSRGGLFDLTGTAREAEAVANLLGGTHIAHATAEAFLARAAEFDILHIGTHGFAHLDGTGNSYLLFEGANGIADRVSRAQVAGMRLDQQLVVLSACNTGIGAIKGGEGTASLARAFFQAGSKSVVSGLWQVPDAGTSEIMVGFYRNLAQGMKRSEALREAKLSYLDSRPDATGMNPFHWAGLVMYGEDGPIITPPWWRTWGWPLGIISALVLLVIAYKRSRSSTARAS